MFNFIREWYVSRFIVITRDEAIAKGLVHDHDVCGDAINRLSGWQRVCRSIWKHPELDRYYRVDAPGCVFQKPQGEFMQSFKGTNTRGQLLAPIYGHGYNGFSAIIVKSGYIDYTDGNTDYRHTISKEHLLSDSSVSSLEQCPVSVVYQTSDGLVVENTDVGVIINPFAQHKQGCIWGTVVINDRQSYELLKTALQAKDILVACQYKCKTVVQDDENGIPTNHSIQMDRIYTQAKLVIPGELVAVATDKAIASTRDNIIMNKTIIK